MTAVTGANGLCAGTPDIPVAVVVPVYNVEAYLARCVESLLAQTYTPAEIILVDDGSTDSSGRLCDDYASQYAHVSVVHKKNEGLGFARNSGMEAVKNRGGYIAFVDSDDWLEVDALEKLVGVSQNGSADCVIAGFNKVASDGAVIFEESLDNGSFSRDGIVSNLLPRLCGSSPSSHDSVPMSVCACLFRMEAIDRNGLRFHSERELISEDFIFKFEFLSCSDCAVTTDARVYNYRFNGSSLTTSYRADRFEASMHLYEYVVAMIEDAGLPRSAVTRLQKSLLIYVRMCVGQERILQKRGQRSLARKHLRAIVESKDLQQIVGAYPIASLGFKQRFFAEMLKRRRVTALLLCLRLGLV